MKNREEIQKAFENRGMNLSIEKAEKIRKFSG
jgi:hypothetical protein